MCDPCFEADSLETDKMGEATGNINVEVQSKTWINLWLLGIMVMTIRVGQCHTLAIKFGSFEQRVTVCIIERGKDHFEFRVSIVKG